MKCKSGCSCRRHRGQKCEPDCQCGRHFVPHERVEKILTTKRENGNWGISEETARKISESQKGMRHGKLAAGRFSDGRYVYLTMMGGHPLAQTTGILAEHRKVLYDKIGPGPHYCHWNCGKLLEWGGIKGIIADHLDDNGLNNDPENLVPSCHRCNWNRTNPKSNTLSVIKESDPE